MRALVAMAAHGLYSTPLRARGFTLEAGAAEAFAAHSSSPSAATQGLSKLWQADRVEHQLREMMRGKPREAPPPSRAPQSSKIDAHHTLVHQLRTERDAALQAQRSLQAQLVHERQENRDLENEFIAFKNRMEGAISSFEDIVEQAAQEKAELLRQLHVAEHQSKAAGWQPGPPESLMQVTPVANGIREARLSSVASLLSNRLQRTI